MKNAHVSRKISGLYADHVKVSQQMLQDNVSGGRTAASHHKRDVDGSDDVDLWVTSGLLRHKHKGLGVQGIKLRAVLQESHIFPWPVFSGVEKVKGETSVSQGR